MEAGIDYWFEDDRVSLPALLIWHPDWADQAPPVVPTAQDGQP